MEKHSIGRYIASIYRYQSILINKQFEQYGIGCGQHTILINIALNPGINQKDLSERVKIDRANTHRAIKKLEALGYIHTDRDEDDKQIIRSCLTEKGEKLMPSIKSGLHDITEIMIKNFEDPEREEITNLLQKIEENVQKYVKSLRDDS
ncbi:HTH-type transcriptional regulator SarZ [Desulfosporosinus acididurans]|uniref:HTH-type transcriptional regulator SarZ n=1 Tax=Desulfosporosinus acididurans TaxID=476652 RepID=A0A0J1FKT8_9FIRM|nr:MarR family winged helix-turn-helix transcriptional regulator [Desulfosporosinus acididurans]KLU64104.1 HTH-type transcriptional regulator SarZ [Desulfosporosinus acididurans]